MPDLVPALTKYRETHAPRLTLEALAERVGVSVGHLSRVERFGTASFPLALRLSEATGMPVTTFAPRTIHAPAAA